jgi:hypothetical protein
MYEWHVLNERHNDSIRYFPRQMCLALHYLPNAIISCKFLFNDRCTESRIEIGTTTKNINVDLVIFRIRVCTEMALGQHKHTRGPVRLKLVKGPRDDCKLAPFSDSIHDVLEVGCFRDPHAGDETDKVPH